MNRPHGRCRLFHCVSYLPLPSNTCTRWFSRSATYTQPSASQVMLCAMLNSPGSVPGPPQERSSLADGVVPILGEPDRVVGAMKTPWARGNIPSPNERRKLPSQSNTIIGCSPRLKTKTLSSRSTPTPPISLNDQPGGSFAQFSTGSYVYSPLPTVVMARIPRFCHSRSLSRSGGFGQVRYWARRLPRSRLWWASAHRHGCSTIRSRTGAYSSATIATELRRIAGFRDRSHAAHRRMYEIQHMTTRQRRGAGSRHVATYRALIAIAEEVVAAAQAALQTTARMRGKDLMTTMKIDALRDEIAHYCDLGARVIDQARRRVLDGEQVPTADKIYSIFEPHTDLIKRGKVRTPVEFGHKV